MAKTKIQWTDHSINPIRATKGNAVGHYCEKVSSGCAHCYSSEFQKRFKMPPFPGRKRRPPLPILQDDVVRVENGIDIFLDESKLQEVLRRKKPTTFFWCDMTDLFGEWVPFEWIDKCFATMALTPRHVHQILTKRPERMAEYFERIARNQGQEHHWYSAGRQNLRASQIVELCGILHGPSESWITSLPNVWLGTSCENQEAADNRIPHLLKCPASVRFVSAEPLLGPIDFDNVRYAPIENAYIPALSADRRLGCIIVNQDDRQNSPIFPRLSWVIVGGESGPKARPCDIEWVRFIVSECRAANVPVFVKQLGTRPQSSLATIEQWPEWRKCCHQISGMGPQAVIECRLKDRKGGNPEEWPEDLRIRQFPRGDRLSG